MKDFVDRIAVQPHRYKMTKETDGSFEYVTMDLEDSPSVEGTPLNREAFMAVQGFRSANTSISKADGFTTISASYADGGNSETTISKDESGSTIIVELYTGESGQSIKKTTTISKSGDVTNIMEVLE